VKTPPLPKDGYLAASPGSHDPERFKWAQATRAAWKALFEAEVAAAWGSEHDSLLLEWAIHTDRIHRGYLSSSGPARRRLEESLLISLKARKAANVVFVDPEEAETGDANATTRRDKQGRPRLQVVAPEAEAAANSDRRHRVRAVDTETAL